MRNGPACGQETARLAVELIRGGVDRGLIIMRHAARHYDAENPINEPFMGLTDEGKRKSFEWGGRFPVDVGLNLFSSHISRCVETAYLIDKGHVAAGGHTRSNIIEKSLSPFYVRDIQGLFKDYLLSPDFFSRWFSGAIPASIIMPPQECAPAMKDFWRRRLLEEDQAERSWDVGITHDWNLYMIRHFFLDLAVEEQDKADFLDGVILYVERSRCFMVTPGQLPRKLDI